MTMASDASVHTVSAGRSLIDCLLANGVPLMTCVPGESFLGILDAVYEVSSTGSQSMPPFITTRHEAAAANMAEAAGKLTGRPAVCFVTRGPGATHASIAIHTAYQDGTPMLLVVGQAVRGHLGREAFQEMDYRSVFASTAKMVAQIEDADRIPEIAARAIHVAVSGRPGPVVLVIPEDVLLESTEAVPLLAPTVVPAGPTAEGSETVLNRLAKAERPLIVAGGPGWSKDVAQRVTSFAERSNVPLATAFRWQDAIDNRSPSYVGYLGLGCNPRLHELAKDADMMFVLGVRLDDATTSGFRLTEPGQPAPELLFVYEEATEFCRSVIPNVAVTCGLDAFSRALAEAVLPERRSRSSWVELLHKEHQEFVRTTAVQHPVNLGIIVKEIRSALPDDAIITTGAGNYTGWVQRFFEFRETGTYLGPRNGAMGYGLPAALSAAAIYPGRKVVAFAGDGCFLMSGHELATAVQNELDVVIVVVNNEMYGTIRTHQERSYPGRVFATNLSNPDFAAYARSFGATGVSVHRTEEFRDAFHAALDHPGPALIEICTDRQQLTPDLRLG
jgi:acetolactate synthase I/II/III large subunit